MHFWENNVLCKNISEAKAKVQFRKLIPMTYMFLSLYQRSLFHNVANQKKKKEFLFSVVYRTIMNKYIFIYLFIPLGYNKTKRPNQFCRYLTLLYISIYPCSPGLTAGTSAVAGCKTIT